MIKILFPAGGYGTYLARCLYNYTNLRIGQYSNFVFDKHGSSHELRENLDAHGKILIGHLDSYNYKSPPALTEDNQLITILPCPDHILDYYNNVYFKQYNGHLTTHILRQMPISEINQKLKDGWNYHDSLTLDTTPWILREFLSLWIVDCFNDGYSTEAYGDIASKIKITTQDIITSIEKTIVDICQAFDLTINVTTQDILLNHQNFLLAQRYHNSQLKCNNWVDVTVNSSISLDNPCQTIFDEAYVQHIFRTQGYEIKCDGLNVMPTTSLEMKELIYKI